MIFDFNFYSSLLLVFFVHGTVYAAMLWRKGSINENRSDKWLSLFIILCLLYIAPWMLGFAGWYDNQPYRDILFYVPFQHLFLIGPVIFFYVQSLLNPSFRFHRKEWLHLLPGIVYVCYTIAIAVADNLLLKRYYFLADGADRDFDSWYQWAGFFSMIIYFFLSYRYYSFYYRLMLQVVSFADIVAFRWIRNFLIAFSAMLILQLLFTILSVLIPETGSYIGTWWYFLCFAIIFYYIAISGYSNAVEAKIAFVPNLLKYRPVLFLNFQPEQLGLTSAAEPELVEVIPDDATGTVQHIDNFDYWKEKVDYLFTHDKIYTSEGLTLTQLARLLQTNPSFVSALINKGFGVNFNDFVNQYRVDAVKLRLLSGEHKIKTLLSIAFECGFSSKATFNRAFKKHAGKSPKNFIGDLS